MRCADEAILQYLPALKEAIERWSVVHSAG